MGKITTKILDKSDKMLRERSERNLRTVSKEVEFLVREAEKQDKKVDLAEK